MLAGWLTRAAARRWTVPLVCLFALVARLAASFATTNHFWSYTAYYFLAETLVHGGGYCMEPGRLCAFFPPVFPTVVGAAILTGHVVAGVMALNSLAGAGTVWMTWLIGRRMFSPAVGLLAAVYAAVYPYFVWHDGVLQENAVLAFVVAVAIWFLLRAVESESRGVLVGAGLALSLTVLTKANLASYVPLALLWIVWRAGWKRALWVSVGVVMLLGSWTVRTWRVTGAPILYSNGGFSLWTANNRLTFDTFPVLSIDAAQEPEWLDVPPADRHAMYELHDPQFIRETQWFWNRGMEFIRANPGLTARRTVQKVWVAFSPVFSPAHTAGFEAVYFVSYFPLFVLAPIGMWRARGQWRGDTCIYLLIASFMVSCAVFWGHTSHRMYLEPYLMIYAASASMPRAGDHDL